MGVRVENAPSFLQSADWGKGAGRCGTGETAEVARGRGSERAVSLRLGDDSSTHARLLLFSACYVGKRFVIDVPLLASCNSRETSAVARSAFAIVRAQMLIKPYYLAILFLQRQKSIQE
jgi:hypothetical protein